MKIGIAGLGVVGGALFQHLMGVESVEVHGYDKYKMPSDPFDTLLACDMIFLCLPTLYSIETHSYNFDPIYEVCDGLYENGYYGLVVIKSTVESGRTEELVSRYDGKLQFIHNPEFLTARTALYDTRHQSHIVLGRSSKCTDDNLNKLIELYRELFPEVDFSLISSTESETMKIAVNCFYATKVQYFTELYLLCQKLEISFDNVRDTMLKNNWIHPQHTSIPGPDGNISYGGMCFPKDTNALAQLMSRHQTPHSVMDAVVSERNSMREKSD